MTKTLWLILLGGVLAGGAILIGILNTGGSSQADAQQAFCSSVSTLKGSVSDLAALSPTSASKDDYESALDDVEDDWDAVESAASDLADVTTSQLSDAWDSFDAAVEAVHDDASVSDALDGIKAATQTFASSVASTLSGPDCS